MNTDVAGVSSTLGEGEGLRGNSESSDKFSQGKEFMSFDCHRKVLQFAVLWKLFVSWALKTLGKVNIINNSYTEPFLALAVF